MNCRYCPQFKTFSFFAIFIFLLLILAGVLFLYPLSNLRAQTNDTTSFQGKIVRNDSGYEGLNVTSTDTTCINDSGADTCDFQVIYYDASTGGNTLGTEEFSNIEIGDYDGVFNLALGGGSWTAGTESTWLEIYQNNTTVYAEVKFDPTGLSSFTETFDRMAVRAAPFAINSFDSERLGGRDSSGFVQLAPSSAQDDANTSGYSSIFINKTAAATGNILQLQKNSVDLFLMGNDGGIGIGNAAQPAVVSSTRNLSVDVINDSTSSSKVGIYSDIIEIGDNVNNASGAVVGRILYNGPTSASGSLRYLLGGNFQTVHNGDDSGDHIDYLSGTYSSALNVGPGSVTEMVSAQSQALNQSSGTIETLIGSRGIVSNQSNGSITTEAIGVSGSAYNEGSGTIASAYAGKFRVLADPSTGKITSVYGINISVEKDATATAWDNSYGIYLNQVGTMGSVNDYAIYSNMTGDSYLAGSLGIGTTTINDELEVNGIIDAASYYKLGDSKILDVENSTSLLVGQGAGASLTAGANYNTLIGQDAGYEITGGDRNVAIGYRALYNADNGSFDYESIAIGAEALFSQSGGYNNIGIGNQALYNETYGSDNNVIGEQAGYWAIGAYDNVFIGSDTAAGTSPGYLADYNVIIGNEAAFLISDSSDSNVIIGRRSGYNLSGSGNIFLGYQAGYSETGSNKLYIENSNSTSPLIYGDFSSDFVTVNGSLGLGTTTINEVLNITGRLYISDTSAPGTTTNRLYSVSGDLFWNGIDLTGSGGLPTGSTEGQTLRWDNTGGSWLASSILVNDGTDITIAGNLLPDLTANDRNIGSDTQRFQDLYLQESSIHIGATGDEGIISYNTSFDRFEFDKTVRVAVGAPAAAYRATLTTTPTSASYGMAISDSGSTGGTNYGIHIDLDDASSTNYSIYVVSGSGDSYLGSRLGIGDTTPDYELDVEGDINLGTGSDVYRIAGTQVLYYPGAPFYGSLIVGDGGTNFTDITVYDGDYNTYLGIGPGTSTTRGYANTAIGSFAFDNDNIGRFNTVLGYYALNSSEASYGTVAIGSQALDNAYNSRHNVALGSSSMVNADVSANNLALGVFTLTDVSATNGGITAYADAGGGQITVTSAGHGLSNGTQVRILGTREYYGIYTISNVTTNTFEITDTFVSDEGQGSWMLAYEGFANTIVGNFSGSTLTTGSYNILLGYDVEPTAVDGDYQLNIGDTIFGDLSSGQIGIGTSTVSGAALTVAQTNAANLPGILIDTEEDTADQMVFNIISDVGGDETSVLEMTADGHLGLAGTQATTQSYLRISTTSDSSTESKRGVYTKLIESGNNSSLGVAAIMGEAEYTGTGDLSYLYGGAFQLDHYTGTTGTATNAASILADARIRGDGTIDNAYLVFGQMFHTSTSTINDARGVQGRVESSGGGYIGVGQAINGDFILSGGSSMGTGYGSIGQIHNEGTGSITNAYATFSEITAEASAGAITNVFGHYINLDKDATASSWTNSYGIYLNSTGTMGTSNDYAIFSNMNSASYLAGSLSIGAGSTTNEMLNIAGRIFLTDAGAPGTTTGRLYRSGSDLYWDGTNLTGGGALPAGSSEGQTLRWDNTGGAWLANSALLNDGTDITMSGDLLVSGHGAIGNTAAVGTNRLLSLSETSTTFASPFTGANIDLSWNPSGDPTTNNLVGANITVESASGNAQDFNQLYGIYTEAVHRGDGSVNDNYGIYAFSSLNAGSITDSYGGYMYGVGGTTRTIGVEGYAYDVIGSAEGTSGGTYGAKFTAYDATNTSTGTDNTYGVYTTLRRTAATGGTINSYGYYLDINNLDNAGAGTHTAYGLYLENVTGADTNYGIYSAGGENYFAGYVGIGVTDPGVELDVGGTIRIPNTESISAYDSGGTTRTLISTDASNNVTFLGTAWNDMTINNAGSGHFTILNGGNVGIGTSSPESLLQIEDAAALDGSDPVIFNINSTTNSNSWTADAVWGALDFASDDASYDGTRARIVAGTENTVASVTYMGFYTQSGGAPSEKMRITGLGDVGIGVTPSNFKLEVAGDVGPSADDTYDLGSSSYRWQDLYLGPASLHIGDDTNGEAIISYAYATDTLSIDANLGILGMSVDGDMDLNGYDDVYRIAGNQILSNPEISGSADTTNLIVGDGGQSISWTTGSQGKWNTLVGKGAGGSLTLGFGNTLFGFNAGSSITTANYNVALGRSAGEDTDGGSNNVYVGGYAGRRNDSGANNIGVGYNALYNALADDNNIAIGQDALETLNGSTILSQQNIAIGRRAMEDMLQGSDNIAIGTSALDAAHSTDFNIAIGSFTLGSFVGASVGANTYNTAIGFNAAPDLTTGATNSIIGARTAFFNQTGSNNAILGYEAGYGVSANSYNNSALLGYRAGYGLTTGSSNTLIGYTAGDNITSGGSNIIIGAGADAPSATADDQLNIGNTLYGDLSSNYIGIGDTTPDYALDVVGDINLEAYSNRFRINTEQVLYLPDQATNDGTIILGNAAPSLSGATNNILVGMSLTGQNLTSGDANIFMGYQAGGYTTTSSNNIYLGSNAGAYLDGDDNVAIGYQVAEGFTGAGYENVNRGVFLGTRAGQFTDSGSDGNVFIGYEAGMSAAVSDDNVYVGNRSGGSNEGAYNVFVGSNSGPAVALGGDTDNSVGVGYRAGYNLTEGYNNTLIGYRAGDSITSGDNNILIGYNIDVAAATDSNKLNVGDLIYGDLSTTRVSIGTSTLDHGFRVQSNDGVLFKNNGVGFTLFNTFDTDLENGYIRGSMLMDRNADMAWDSTNNYWNKTDANAWGAIMQRHNDGLGIFSGTGTITNMTNTNFRNNYERITILSSGYVGVSNTSPSVALDVTGAVEISDTLTVDGDGVYFDNAGNIGDGLMNTIPQAAGNDYVRGSLIFARTGDLVWDDTGGDWDKPATSNTDWSGLMYRGTNQTLSFYAGSGTITNMSNATFRSTYEKLTIEGSTGEVGVGDITPDYKLDVAGDVNLDSNADALRIAGDQVLYKPQTNGQSSSLFVGNGGGSLAWSVGLQTYYNTSVGVDSGVGLTTGRQNTFLGYSAGNAVNSGDGNTLIGYMAGDSITNGWDNVAIGVAALDVLVGGAVNVAIGVDALGANTGSSSNVAIGDGALDTFNTTSNGGNTGVGSGVMDDLTDGVYNTAVGNGALANNTTGDYNVAIGTSSGLGAASNSSSYGVSVGYNTGINLTSGNSNIILGYNSGNNISTGSSNIVIGVGVSPASGTASNQLNVGDTLFATSMNTTSRQVGINDSSPSYRLDVNGTIRGYGITDSSDIRLKENVTDVTGSLNKLMQLRGVNYYWKDKSNYGSSRQLGFIAQEVESVVPEVVSTDSDGYKSIAYSKLTALIVEGIQEQQIQIGNAKSVNTTQTSSIGTLTSRVDELYAAPETLQYDPNGNLVLQAGIIADGRDILGEIDEISSDPILANPLVDQLLADYENGLLGGYGSGDLTVTGDLQLEGKLIVGDGTGILNIEGGLDVDSIATQSITTTTLTAASIGAGTINTTTLLSETATITDLTASSIDINGGAFVVNQTDGVKISSDLVLDGILSSTLEVLEIATKIKGTDGRLEVEGTLAAEVLESNTLDSDEVKTKQVEVNREDVAGASAGKATVVAGEEFVLIETTAVLEDSLVFVTAERSSDGSVAGLAVDEQVDGEFKVYLKEISAVDVEFNWWVVK